MKFRFSLEEKDFQFLILGHTLRNIRHLGDWIENVVNRKKQDVGYVQAKEHPKKADASEAVSQDANVLESEQPKPEKKLKTIDSFGYDVLADLIMHLAEFGNEYKLCGNLWQAVITSGLMEEESVFALASEIKKDPGESLMNLAKLDAKRLFKIFWYDGKEIADYYGDAAWESIFAFQSTQREDIIREEDPLSLSNPIGIRILALCEKLADCDNEDAFLNVLLSYYQKNGVGIFGLYKSFLYDWDGVDQNRRDVYSALPVERMDHVSFDELIGYETQKRQLIENTESFVKGGVANNCLLYGDSGTGKSTCIRSVINLFLDEGLRLLEIPKYRIDMLPNLVQKLKDRNYRFILYMDDLSFEEYETDYKALKAIIEGGVNQLPKNFIVYATTNRRHLVKETWKMRRDEDEGSEVFRSESVEELLSLSQRFGINIYFSKPTFKEYLEMIKELVKKEGMDVDEEALLAEAKKWELEHGGVSGRTARQFVNYMKMKK